MRSGDFAGIRVVSRIANLFRRFRGREFLEARIIPQRIEHWIELEQRGN